MTANSDPLENLVAERIKGIFKQEYLSHQAVRSLAEAEQYLERAVFLYNYKRLYLNCDMQSLHEAHGSWGPQERLLAAGRSDRKMKYF